LNTSKFNKAALLSLPIMSLLLLVPGAYASPPVTGSGTFNATVATETVVHSDNGNTLYQFTGQDDFTGTETGTGPFTLSLLVHSSGADTGSGTITCSCTVGGQTGTINIQFTSSGTFGGSGDGHFEDTGSGGLAGYHGVGVFQFVTTATGFTGPYQIQYHFDG
jgi:hypothetical protein